MAKKALRTYTFAPGAANSGYIYIPGYWPLESFLLITNTTNQTIIYNFADTALGGTTSYNSGGNFTTLTLEASTATQFSSDKLQIFVDDYRGMEFIPTETYQDPVSKLRVSTPQALIDTDFEYSLQSSKWESLALVQNYPSFFSRGTNGVSLDVTAMNGNGAVPRSIISVTTSTAHNLSVGDVVNVQDSALPETVDGTFIITQIPNSTSFSYICKGSTSSSLLYILGTTQIAAGGVWNGAIIPLQNSATAMQYTGANITVYTASAHGLLPGSPIIVNNISAGINAPNGNFIINSVTGITSFTYTSYATPTGVLSSGGNFASAQLYVGPESYQQHRSFDGGVLISSANNAVGVQQIRQTRKYFRYQSGKGIQFSTGVKFTPSYDVVSIIASSTTITVTTLQDHGLQSGAQIFVEGVVSSAGGADSARYNGTYTVLQVTGAKTFTYTTATAPTDTAPGGVNVFITVTGWSSASVRTGLYDEQNGFYFQYDGLYLWAVLRQSVKELFGQISVTQNSSIVNGTGTVFLKQLIVGDKIIIRGQSYQVTHIVNNTQLTIAPAYRGSQSVTGTRFLKTQEMRIPQIAWNLDRLDGTGPSGYALDVKNMQMAYIDYTWYGAGFIRFGFRATNGEIIYCHKIVNNNNNKSAYMRSGNLPARFETLNLGYSTKLIAGGTGTLGSALTSASTVMWVEDANGWPSSGYIAVSDGTNLEIMLYTTLGSFSANPGGYPISGLTRRTSFNIAGISPTTGVWSQSAFVSSGTTNSVTFTPDVSFGVGTPQVSVRLMRNNCAPAISHWGVSTIMDGRYDNDTSFVFNAVMQRYLSINAGNRFGLLAVRIAPSADSGIGAGFGLRQLINRMQLKLSDMSIYSQGQFLIEVFLNPVTMTGDITFPGAWTAAGSGSLAQVAYFNNGGTAGAQAAATATFTGGDRIFSGYTENSGGNNFSATTFDLSNTRELGNSIIGGNGTSSNPSFPAGPDVLLVTARNIAATGTSNIAVNVAWTEASA